MVIIQIYPKNLSVWANQDESNELFSLIVFRLKANIRPFESFKRYLEIFIFKTQ